MDKNKEIFLIKCILFDLDNTLIETREADAKVCEKIAKDLKLKYSLSNEEATSMAANFLSNFRRCPENKLMSLDEWRTHLWSQALGEKYQEDADLIYQNWLTQRYQHLAMSQEITYLLKSLRKKFRIALITNGTSACQWEKINKLQLKSCFDLILVSGDLSYEKPDKNIFFQACEVLNVNPKNCLMVGDKLETDIEGGLQAGLAGTVWIPLNRHYRLTDDDPKPDYVLKNIMELKDLLRKLEGSQKWSNELKYSPSLRQSNINLEEDCSASTSFSDYDVPKLAFKQFSNVFNIEENSNSNASDGS
ncbi:N-acylneuraminate-9-phosphatase isoform X1 [Euwallacea similis]|uniref:N-acylneuraminate-9-phosphatase isoform X1 n=1 Tax=Euwallacea similis TaxID=1736056 RepID=UPI00344DD02E